MKTVKMFDFFEDGIHEALEENKLIDDFFQEYVEANDSAISWYIATEEEEKEQEGVFGLWFTYHTIIDKILREAGCESGETVFIWISW